MASIFLLVAQDELSQWVFRMSVVLNLVPQVVQILYIHIITLSLSLELSHGISAPQISGGYSELGIPIPARIAMLAESDCARVSWHWYPRIVLVFLQST